MVSASELHTLALPLGVAAGAAMVLWCLLVFALVLATRSRRPEPQSAGLEMGGPEPPTVVDLLCHGWKLGREAVPATLVDLAARKMISFKTSRPGHDEVLITGPEPADLTPYERQVLAHVRSLAHNGVVPCKALTTGPENESNRWFRQFERAVIRDARARGLSRSRWSKTVTLVVGIAALVPAGLASGALTVLSAQQNTDSSESSPVGAFIGLSLIVWFVLMAGFARLRAERDTAAGLEAAGRWLGLAENLQADGTFPDLPPTAVAIWDRYLAHAVAFGLAETTARTVALGSESDTDAWSAVGGRWRIVRVRYPSRIPPGWGRPPWRVLVAGAVESAVLGGALVVVAPAIIRAGRDFLRQQGDDQRWLTVGLKTAFFVYVVVVAVWLARAIAMLMIGLVDVSRSKTVEGQVVRMRRRTKQDDAVVTHIAVDDGTDDNVRAWIPSMSPPGLQQGRWVRAVVSPRLGFVRSLDLMPSPDSGVSSVPPSPAAVDHDASPPVIDVPGLLGAAVLPELRSVAPVSQPSRLCSLDVAWLSQLVGVPLAATDPEGGAGFVAQFTGQDAHITASVAPAGTGSEMYEQAARVPRLARSTVEGTGDEALWIMRSTLVARSGDTTVTVGVRVKGLDGEQRLHIASEIARQVLAPSAST